MSWKTLGLIALLYSAVPASASVAEDGIPWFGSSFEAALKVSERQSKPLIVYFWVPGSAQCVQMYEATMQDPSAAKVLEPFIVFSAKHGESTELFERYNIKTVPAVRLINFEGEADDGINGFADPGSFAMEMERMVTGEGTLSDLMRQIEEAPEDLELRNKLAGKYFDLGDQDRHDEIQGSIKEADPEGRNKVAAMLHFNDVTKAVAIEATRPDELKLDLVYKHVEKGQKTMAQEAAFSCWTYISQVENALGNFDGEYAAIRNAWETVPEEDVLNWGNSTATWLWSNRDQLSKRDKALALDMARKASAQAELLRDGGEAAGGSRYAGDNFDAFLAGRMTTLAKCLYMNGEHEEALAVAERCAELNSEGPAYAKRVECYRKKQADGCLEVYNDTRPVWSGGNKIVFTSDRDGNQELYVADLKKGSEKRLTRFLGNEQSASWSSKSKTIAFNSDRFMTTGIYTMKPNGKDISLLVPFDPNAPASLSDPAFSPDGKHIAYATDRNGKSEIAVMDADGKNERILTASTPKADMQPTWSRKGNRIMFMSNRVGDSDVYSISPDGEEEVNVTNAPENSWDMDPELSPDGKKVVFSSWRSEKLEVYVMNADGSEVVNLTNSETEDRHPRWSPNGKKIAFDRKLAEGNTRIFVMNADGSEPAPLVEL